MRPFEAVILGYYGMGNLGDELILTSLMDLFASVGVGPEKLAVLSGNPSETEKNHGIKAFDRWSIAEIFRACRMSRTFLLGGGGLLQDSTGINSVLYYGLVLLLSSWARCVPWVYGNSLGPLGSGLSRNIAGFCLKHAEIAAFRDKTSMSLAESLGIKAIKCPDAVLTMEQKASEGREILVNLRPWDGKMELMAGEKLGKFLKDRGRSAIGVAMARGDRCLMENLRKKNILPLKEIISPKNHRDFIWNSGGIAFGMRLHFCVMASLMGMAGVAIPYDPKVRDFASSVSYPLWSGYGKIPEPVLPDGKALKAMGSESRRVFKECFGKVSS